MSRPHASITRNGGDLPTVVRARTRIGPLARRTVTGGVLAMGIAAAICAVTGAISDGRAVAAFAFTGALCGALSVALHRSWRGRPMLDATGQDALMAAGLTWVISSILAAIPLALSGALPGVAHAIFEGASGITTTGGTAVVDVDGLPDAVLLWRSLTHWIGGIGIVVLLVAIAPAAGGAARRVLLAESSRASDEAVAPQIRDTARITGFLYLGVTAIFTVVLLAVGLSPWDAINHAMSVIAAGGFSTHTASGSHWESPAIEIAFTVLMFAAGISYITWWRLVARRPLAGQWPELRAYTLFTLVAGAILAVIAVDIDGAAAVRDGMFTAASLTSGSGMTTADVDEWGEGARLVALLCMFSGGCVGATTGGFKVRRWLLLAAATRAEIRRQIAPQRIVVVRVGGKPVSDEAVGAAFGFMALAFLALIFGTAVLAASGLDLLSAVSGTAACLFNVGPALGSLGGAEPYSEVPDGGLVTLSFIMVLGRLEMFTLLALFTRRLWRVR